MPVSPSSVVDKVLAMDKTTLDQVSSEGAHISHALGSIHHQIRSFGQRYSSTAPLQKLITAEKGVAIDFEGVSKASKAQSKELYTWGQKELVDLRDVTDRIANLNAIEGSLASDLSTKLNAARAPLKKIRDADAALTQRRNHRADLQTQVSEMESNKQSGQEKRIAELKEQLEKATKDTNQLERDFELLKREAIRNNQREKWAALREFGEKLVLISQAVNPILDALPSVPPDPARPYMGVEPTAAIHASLQQALDNHVTGTTTLSPVVSDRGKSAAPGDDKSRARPPPYPGF